MVVRNKEKGTEQYLLRETQRAIYTKGEPEPYTSTMTHILNTPSQMQRECNDVAFGELILSTRLNKKKLIHPKSEIKDVVEACNF